MKRLRSPERQDKVVRLAVVGRWHFPCSDLGMCFFDVAVPGGWYKGYESQVWFGVWLGGMIRGMARAPLNFCFVALDTAKLPCAGNWIAVRIWTA